MITKLMENKDYHPEPYWSVVAKRIEERGDQNIIAGDDEPFYRYKRVKFVELLNTVDFKNKRVLEIGSGPGGNLIEIAKSNPSELCGVDISQNMIDLSKNIIGNRKVTLIKINGTELPFSDKYFDIAFTATVLQHNSDEKMLDALIQSICRVTKNEVVLFELIESKFKGTGLCVGRPQKYYEDICEKYNFRLISTEYLDIQASYYVCGSIRILMNSSSRKEGMALNRPSVLMQSMLLPITKKLDKIFKPKRDVAKMTFRRV